ncbi:MAG: hypothetical protein M1814_006444 [Vezdaea aestivalis]|nr:MAG: hypothetical protein M1814_006444 [Vezdaea aestivalis]
MPNAASSATRPTQRQNVVVAATPRKKTSLALNDDAQEKAVRFQSRQALHDLQMNQIKAAVSPMRKLDAYNRAASSSPKTPRGSLARGSSVVARPREPENDGLQVVGGKVVTPMKRVPLLANFEEWMKMATDNKINAANSWNFALIDYFHDMSLLKEGDGVNFQKASCTLDGCVKIYTSRVDSVATETGKLLSGLADSGNKRSKNGEHSQEDGEEGSEEEEEGEDGVRKRVKKKVPRSSEATLAPSFTPLRLKKFELEFSVDPLFKKASADFDEGGAKGLLLNHLAIDGQGRIVFDSSDDTQDVEGEANARRRKSTAQESDEDRSSPELMDATEAAPELSAVQEESQIKRDVDITSLASRFFPDLDLLEEQDICPSLKTFDLGDSSGGLDIPFLKAPEEWKQTHSEGEEDVHRSHIEIDDDNAPGFDDDGMLGGFDIPADAGFGEGGEAWARDAALEPQLGVYNRDNGSAEPADGEEGMEVGDYFADGGSYGINVATGHQKGEIDHDNILNYFDQALQKNWAGPEHWRIRKIKDGAKPTTLTPKARKEKEPFVIDFLAPLDPATAELIYTPASSNTAISLPKTQWKSKTRNLLPDDKHFNSRDLLRLFLKPRAQLGSKHQRRVGPKQVQHAEPEGEMDEAFWARREDPLAVTEDEPGVEGNYDANFFQDDGLAFPCGIDDDDDEFTDAQDHFSPGLETDEAGDVLSVDPAQATEGGPQGAFGAQLVTQSRRLRPEYVQYARVAKKVDVRRLKEEMWKGMALEEPEGEKTAPTPSKTQPRPVSKTDDGLLKFTSVMGNLQTVYPKQAMADISTSYCFICLLHLANEKGLEINSNEGLTELSIRKDKSAVIEGKA